MVPRASNEIISEQLTWLVERLLELLSSMAAAGESEKAFRFRSELKACREQLAHPTPGESLDTIARKCLALCQDYFEQDGAFRLNHDAEYAGIVDLLRTAIASFAELECSDDLIITSTKRFRDIASGEDVHQLRLRIEREVQIIEKVFRERQDVHRKTVDVLSRKVESLEQRLSKTRKRLNQTEAESSLDPLTKVSNRRHFDQQLDRWVRAGRNGRRFVLAMLDMDNLKQVNDGYGHQAGDRALRDVAQHIRSMVRNDDILARYGGDEFTLLLQSMSFDRGLERCRRICDGIRNYTFPNEDEDGLSISSLKVSVSCGLTEYVLGDSPQDVLDRADRALYQAKRSGKNRAETHLKSGSISSLSQARYFQ